MESVQPAAVHAAVLGGLCSVIGVAWHKMQLIGLRSCGENARSTGVLGGQAAGAWSYWLAVDICHQRHPLFASLPPWLWSEGADLGLIINFLFSKKSLC